MEKPLVITASESSSNNDFDFIMGRWRIHNRKLVKRLADCDEWTEFPAVGECRKALNGMANIDSFVTEFDGVPFEGMALRLFNPGERLWRIYWADSVHVALDPPQVGSFDGAVGEFLARDTFEGRSIIVKFHWDATDQEHPVWSQAFSADEGTTWEWNWYMNYERIS